jgi:tRNA(adenine34) deaminase
VTPAATPDDVRFMDLALALARQAAACDEVPVGAVVVLDGAVVGSGFNRSEALGDPTAHAELVALRGAFARTGLPRLPGSTLYCTLEPCVQCAGAILHARVQRVVFGARDPKFGGCVSLYELLSDRRLNHQVEMLEGVAAEASAELLRTFFQARRRKP